MKKVYRVEARNIEGRHTYFYVRAINDKWASLEGVQHLNRYTNPYGYKVISCNVIGEY